MEIHLNLLRWQTTHFPHGFWTVCAHFYISSRLSVGRICKATVDLTNTSHSGTARLCTEGLMLSFSVFRWRRLSCGQPPRHAYIVLKGEGLSQEGACCATRICFPLCSFPRHTFLFHMKTAFQWNDVKFRDNHALKNRFCFNLLSVRDSMDIIGP